MYKVIQLEAKQIFSPSCFIYRPTNSFDMFEKYYHGDFEYSRFVVEEVILLSPDSWTSFTQDLCKSRPYLKDKGGYDSTFSLPHDNSFWSLSKKDHNSFMDQIYRTCVAIAPKDEEESLADNSPCFIVDPQVLDSPQYINPYGAFIIDYLKRQANL